jgi:hypothetical protein
MEPPMDMGGAPLATADFLA